jgi:hypothetical protein
MERNVREAIEHLERVRDEASRSKQPRYKNGKPTDAQFFGSVLRWTTSAAEQEPEYRPDSRTRDSWLANFWTQEPHWAGVVSSVNMIDSNRGWSLIGGRNQVLRFIPVLRDADDGAGWRQYVSQQSTAFYTTDMG